MQIELLTVTGCPNSAVIEQRLSEALAGRGDVQVKRRVIDTVAEAEQHGMHGSPTLLFDGRDPFAGPGTAASVSCRLYRGEDGRATGAPSVADLRRVLADPTEAECCPAPAAVSVGRAGRGRVAPVEGGMRAVYQAVLRSFAATGTAPDLAALEQAAAPDGVPAVQVLARLADEDFLTLDADGQISAAYPFSATPTGVQVELPGAVMVASMCAIDALGIPAMLGVDALITSTDPITGQAIRIQLTSGRAHWEPASAVVFYGARPEKGPSASVCCGYLRFFATAASAQEFAEAHPEATGEIMGPDAAQRLGEEIFGMLLAEPAASVADGTGLVSVEP
jgi:hypothetical protein